VSALLSNYVIKAVESRNASALGSRNDFSNNMNNSIHITKQYETISNGVNNSFLKYESPNLELRIGYPSEWRKIEYDNEDIGSSSTFMRGLVLYDWRHKQDFRLIIELYAASKFAGKEMIDMLRAKQLTNFRLIDSGPSFINKDTIAHMAEYAYTDAAGTNRKAVEFWTERGNGLYTIRFVANSLNYPVYLPIVKKVLDSLELNPDPDIKSSTDNVEEDAQKSSSVIPKFLTYENKTFGIKIDYPSGWKKEVHSGKYKGCISGDCSDVKIHYVLFSDPITKFYLYKNATMQPDIGLLKLEVRESPVFMSHAEWVSTLPTRKEILHNEGRDIIANGSTIISNNTAEKLIIKDVKTGLMDTEITTTIGDRRYILTYPTDGPLQSTSVSTIQRMVDSFEIIQSKKGNGKTLDEIL